MAPEPTTQTNTQGALRRPRLTRRRWFLPAALALMAVLGGAAVFLYAWLRVDLPQPTGPYAVGRIERHLVDGSREERFTPTPGDQRELMVRVYYPADAPPGMRPAPYAAGPQASALAQSLQAPTLLVGRIHAHALAGAPVAAAAASYPLLLFSPGLTTPPLLYTALLEELASHGYIVASIAHTYCVGATAFPDGRVAPASDACSAFESPAAGASREASGRVWVQDARFVLDQLERLNQEDALLAGWMDTSRVGIFGHSFGGATAMRATRLDQRVRAAINMDGTPFPDEPDTGLDRPFLWMRSELLPTEQQLAELGPHRREVEAAITQFIAQMQTTVDQSQPGYAVALRGARHLAYASDWPLIAARVPDLLLPKEELLGTIDGERALRATAAYVVAFFDRHLRGKEAPLLDGPARDYPEVEFRTGIARTADRPVSAGHFHHPYL